MTFISIFLALLIEQLKPLRADNPVYGAIKNFALPSKAGSTPGMPSMGAWAGSWSSPA